MRVPTTIGPFHTEDWIIVTEWVEGSRIGVEHIGVVSGSGRFELVEVDGGTEFRWEEELVLPALLTADRPSTVRFVGGRLVGGSATTDRPGWTGPDNKTIAPRA